MNYTIFEIIINIAAAGTILFMLGWLCYEILTDKKETDPKY